MGVWMTAHAVDDFYQGLIPAAIPFFVLDRGYSYTAASGLALAATLGSSLPQPLFGIIADRRRMPWMSPLGVTVAGVGAGAAGLAQQYWLVWAMLLLSGLGVAAFHPAAGKGARRDAAGSTSAMSLFAAGGSVGFFLAPALVTPALVELGLGATAIFVPPAVLIGFVLWRHELRARTRATTVTDAAGRDRWVPFALLTALEVARSVTFFGVNTFIGVYWIRGLGASQGLGGIALAAFLVGGVGGTLLGGRLGDRLGAVRAVQAGSMLVIPALILLRVVPEPRVALACAVLAGISVNLPFGVLVKLGQDYLPSRPGTAAGVTLGLAVSVGGLFTPVLGELADRHGPGAVFTALCAVPVAAVVLSLMLPQPDGA
ncbi:MFS transporter [Tsukamurella sp. 8F]|uniref:MFS transporter n=1 Tax=unclassified Tsukamurella TaxID=2633480 RepID=UPI0023B9C5FB|nr:MULTISPECIES: MFS transporter [unclassified Tsukamurella]MDF0528481.1 MFS transporter [Tsukamurella sp. 8J]MDF0586307.1 MFS transporter [Tsukamurella sp. 8F]